MTPLPKKKHARSRTRTRKAAISFKIPQLIRCPKCNALRFPHSKCPNCGFYKEPQKANETEKTAKSAPEDKSESKIVVNEKK